MLSRSQILIFLFSFPAFAGWEPSIEGSGRSYPLSGAMAFDLGYSAQVWGGAGSESNPWFGYIRPSVTAFTAGAYNSGRAAIEVFPVSFLGFEAGGEAISNTNEYKAYDCELYNCLGKFWTNYVSGTLLLGAGPVFLVGRAKIEHLRQESGQALDFINPTSGLVAEKDGDELTTAAGAMGLKLSENWNLVYTYVRSSMKEVETTSEMHLGLVSWKSGDWRISAGGGSFRSDIKAHGGTAILSIEWRALPHLGLL